MVLTSFSRTLFDCSKLIFILCWCLNDFLHFCYLLGSSCKSWRGGKGGRRHCCCWFSRSPCGQDKNWRMASSRAHLRFIFISIHRNFSHVFKVEPKGSSIWLQHILFFFFLCRYWTGRKNMCNGHKHELSDLLGWSFESPFSWFCHHSYQCHGNSQPAWPSWWLHSWCQTWQIRNCCHICNHSCFGMLKALHI